MYLLAVTAILQRRKRAEKRVQQLQSKATEAWDSCILLLQEVGDMKETAQHKNIITEGTGDGHQHAIIVHFMHLETLH